MPKDINKPVRPNDPSLNLEGGAKNRIWKRKKETYHQGELFPLAKRKDKFKHDPRTSANA